MDLDISNKINWPFCREINQLAERHKYITYLWQYYELVKCNMRVET